MPPRVEAGEWVPLPQHVPVAPAAVARALRRALARGLETVHCLADAEPALSFRGMRLTRAPFLHVMLAGRQRVVSPAGRGRTVTAGDAVFFAPGSHVNLTFPGRCRYARVTLADAGTFFGLVEVRGPGPGGREDEPVIGGGAMRACVVPGKASALVAHVTALLTRLAGREHAEPGRAAAALVVLLHEWIEHLEGAEDGRRDAGATLILRATHFMEEHGHRPINRQTVADALGVSAAHLSRVFRRVTGRGPLFHLHALRVERARSLLERPGLSVEDIAARCGFTSRSYFSQFYKRATGRTPRGR